MAIHPSENAGQDSTESSFVSIEAWAEDAVQAAGSLTFSDLSPRSATSTRSALEISLDEHDRKPGTGAPLARRILVAQQDPSRRDDLKRRESLLKGNEGSRRRQRWENGWCLPIHTDEALLQSCA